MKLWIAPISRTVRIFVLSILLLLGVTSGVVMTLILTGQMERPYPYLILSGSMAPDIAVGSIVVSVPQQFYTVGEVITFKETGNDTVVTHRIAEVVESAYYAPRQYRTKGDANNSVDPFIVSQNQIIGKVEFALPYLGYLAHSAKTPKGFILFVVIPATIVIYEELKAMKNELGFKATLFVAHFRKKKTEENKPDTRQEKRAIALPMWAIVPIVGAGLLLVAGAGAYFSDHEQSTNNTLGIATSYATPTPTVSQ